MNPRQLIEEIDKKRLALNLEAHFSYTGDKYYLKEPFRFIDAIHFLTENKLITLNKNELELLDLIPYKENSVIYIKTYYEDLIYFSKHILKRLEGVYDYLLLSLEDKNNILSLEIISPSIHSLNDLEKFSKEIKIAFEIPVNELTSTGVEVASVEKGSLWLILAVAAPSILKLCADLIWSAYVIRRKKIECDSAIEQLRTIKVKNDFFEEYSKIQLDFFKQSKDAEAEYIVKKFKEGIDPELTQRVKTAIDTIGDLIEKGVDFKPSLNAPEDVKNLFPSKENDPLKFIESRIKLLASGKSEESANKD